MLKYLITLTTFFLLYTSAHANMSSPVLRGDITSEAYSSKDIDILYEHLQITIIDFYTAKFVVTYLIKSDREGKQIPLIFDTMTNSYTEDGFHVWLNNESIPVSKIPSTYDNPNALAWIDSLDTHLAYPKNDAPDIIGLKYFEVDLVKGEHTIRVEYTAHTIVNKWKPLESYEINYNLKPARYWRSFGKLDIEINTSDIKGIFKTNIDKDSILSGTVTHLHFSEIPKDELIISMTPQTGWFTNVMMGIGASGLFCTFALIVIALHIYFTLRYRQRNPDKRFSPIVIGGSLLVPFLCCCIFIFSYSLLDLIIGEYASGRHGYIFLIFILYPISTPIYFVVIWLIDRIK